MIRQKNQVGQKSSYSSELRERMKEGVKSVSSSYLVLAEGLDAIFEGKYYEAWGFMDFESYCSAELDFSSRKARYLIKVWKMIKDYDIHRDRAEKIGWTKLNVIKKVVNDENVEEWLVKAEEMSVSRLEEEIASLTTKGSSPAPVILKIKMDEDEAPVITEALTAAKRIRQVDNNTSALEMICLDWLESQGISNEKRPIQEHIKYLEKVYGVKLEVAAGCTVTEEAPLEAKESTPASPPPVIDEEDAASIPPDTLLEEDVPVEEEREDGIPDGDLDLDDILGII